MSSKLKAKRISRGDLYMGIAKQVAMRSTCERAQVGAVAVKNGRVLSMGYGGSPAGTEHCLDVGCNVVDGHCIRTIHAEVNAIAWAAREGISLAGSTLYVTHQPCLNCAKLLINSGVTAVTFLTEWGDVTGVSLMADVGMFVQKVSNGSIT